MPDITEVIADLNITISDLETAIAICQRENRIHISRALGQLKAARGCLLVILVKQEVQE